MPTHSRCLHGSGGRRGRFRHHSGGTLSRAHRMQGQRLPPPPRLSPQPTHSDTTEFLPSGEHSTPLQAHTGRQPGVSASHHPTRPRSAAASSQFVIPALKVSSRSRSASVGVCAGVCASWAPKTKSKGGPTRAPQKRCSRAVPPSGAAARERPPTRGAARSRPRTSALQTHTIHRGSPPLGPRTLVGARARRGSGPARVLGGGQLRAQNHQGEY